jgi:hypothetical protein
MTSMRYANFWTHYEPAQSRAQAGETQMNRIALALTIAAISTGAAAQSNNQRWSDLLKPVEVKTNPAIPVAPPTTRPPGQPQHATAQTTPCKVSLAQYQSLTMGMSYSRAVAVLGCEGTELSRSDMAGFRTVMFMWQGNSVAANMNAMFQNDALVTRAQFGLR